MTRLYMGARPTDVLQVVFQSEDVPAGLATIAARDILCSSGARIFRPQDPADTWSLVLPSGGRLRMRDARPGELPVGTAHHQVPVVDVFRSGLPHVPFVLAWAAFFTPNREWQRQFDDREAAHGTLPIAFDDATMARLQDANMSEASHYTFLQNINWVGAAPGQGLNIVAMALPPLSPGRVADRPVLHFDVRPRLGVSGGGAARTSSPGPVDVFRGPARLTCRAELAAGSTCGTSARNPALPPIGVRVVQPHVDKGLVVKGTALTAPRWEGCVDPTARPRPRSATLGGTTRLATARAGGAAMAPLEAPRTRQLNTVPPRRTRIGRKGVPALVAFRKWALRPTLPRVRQWKPLLICWKGR